MQFLLLISLVLSVFTLNTNAQGLVSKDEFKKAVTSNNFKSPSDAQYNGYMKAVGAGAISTKIEAAMFLAQTLHESMGLTKKREIGCEGPNGCPNKYPEKDEWLAECKGAARPKGVSWYGRGYIQLTWCSNYVQASRALGKGDSLKTKPDQVAQSEELSWGVSGWYWKTNVHGKLGGSNAFGITTKAINGREECTGNNIDKSKQRFKYYQKVFAAYKLSGTPNESGCYN